MTLTLTYTPEESLNMIKDLYQANWYNEIKKQIQIISGVAKSNKTTLSHAVKICINLTYNIHEQIRYEAAFHFLNQTNEIQSKIKQRENELSILSDSSASIERNFNKNPKYNAHRRQAIYKKTKEILLEIGHLRSALQNINNLPVKAEIIGFNGSTIHLS